MLGPIFAREALTLPRRPRHYLWRATYLGALWVLGLTTWQATIAWNRSASLGDSARFGRFLFQLLLFAQLWVLIFFAALSAASTVAQEKDRRTFVLLLLTDLRNHEIVLGKLLGALLQMLVFLAITAPLMGFCLFLGGVAPFQVGQGLLVLGATTLAAGSLGGVIALWRDRTYQSLALTVLLLVLYLCLAAGVGVLPFEGAKAWQPWFDPFAALREVVDVGAEGSWRASAYVYTLVMLSLAVLLNGWGIAMLRVWNPSGEPIMQREQPDDAEVEERDRAKAHAAPGTVREVWANPILWREIRTRAYGRRPFLVKLAYLFVLGVVCHYALSLVSAGRPGSDARPLPFVAAYGLVPVGILSLLLVSAQAVTAITSERDTGSLDLLLVTDLTPQEFIFGKIEGILYNVKEFLIPPFVLAGVYAWDGVLASPPRGYPDQLAGRNLSSLVCVWGATLVLLAFVLMLGIHVALRTANSRQAILNSLGAVFFLSSGTLVCIYLIVVSGRFEYQWVSFLLFIAAGVGGLLYVLNGARPSSALTLAGFCCPAAVFYSVMNILIARPGSEESTDPLIPFVVTAGAFGFAVAAMLVPLLSEFDVALGRTGRAEE